MKKVLDYLKEMGNLQEFGKGIGENIYKETLSDEGSAFYKFITVLEKNFGRENLEELLESFYKEYEGLGKMEKESTKNLTLVIFLQLHNLESIKNNKDLRDMIALLEEDQYFFAKTVIPCTKNILDNWSMEGTESLINFVFDEAQFEAFKKKQYSDENYFFAYQLMTNLPFIKLNREAESLKTMEDYLENNPRYNSLIVNKYLSNGHELIENYDYDKDRVKDFLTVLGMKDRYED